MSEVLEVFIPGRPVNALNMSHAHWAKHHRLARKWRLTSQVCILAALRGRNCPAWAQAVPAGAAIPKAVTFEVRAVGVFDEGDNLAATCKPVRDALVDMGLIHGDAPRHGHSFGYRQRKVARKEAGIAMTVAIRHCPMAIGQCP